MKIRPEAELTGWMHDQRAAGERGKRDRQGEGDSLHPDRIDAHQPQRFAVLRNRRDRATEKSRLQEGE